MTTQAQAPLTTLRDLYSSQGYEYFISDRLGNDLFINDPERADRIHEASKDGADGSTHYETINDWRDYLKTLKAIDPDWPEDGGDITDEAYTAIEAEIDACEQWHERNGSLHSQP
jgi:hypothetical protein